MRIGPVIVVRARDWPRYVTALRWDYDRDMADFEIVTAWPDGTPLPPGIRMTRPTNAEQRLRAIGITPLSPEQRAANGTFIPARITDPDEAIRNMHAVSGSISIGRPPRKSDYRARWRYNSEIFDDED
jgi:hypothetical protein